MASPTLVFATILRCIVISWESVYRGLGFIVEQLDQPTISWYPHVDLFVFSRLLNWALPSEEKKYVGASSGVLLRKTARCGYILVFF